MKQLETVRVGVIGPSWWFDYWHLPAIRRHPQAQLVAVCGAKSRHEEDVTTKYGAEVRSYTDWDAMFSETALDGVIVCTPNDLHAPASLAVLRQGLHVTCEKPMAMDAGQAREVVETGRAKNLIGMCNFPYRDNPAVQRFRQRVSEGALGTLLHVRGEYHGGFGLHRPPGWRGLRARSGSGILGDLGSHLIDLVRYVTGQEFISVSSHSLTLLRDADSGELKELIRTEDPRIGGRNDDACAFLAGMSGGAQAVLQTSWVAYQGAAGQHQEIEAFGTRGRLRFVSDHAGAFVQEQGADESHYRTLWDNLTRDASQPSESEDHFRPGRLESSNTTYRWIEAIRTGAPDVSPDLEDGWRAQQVIDAVIRSSAERRWVDL